ncbi:G5 domain-containing protein [Actinomyces vulturis]|uniref:G5 domain-containing protein n=1 Tax=Actinomyces vulturis TaxID=1857645 RepID=UPI00082E31FB|nr:G5 domain-containing protein [Actinomyces vulturis]
MANPPLSIPSGGVLRGIALVPVFAVAAGASIWALDAQQSSSRVVQDGPITTTIDAQAGPSNDSPSGNTSPVQAVATPSSQADKPAVPQALPTPSVITSATPNQAKPVQIPIPAERVGEVAGPPLHTPTIHTLAGAEQPKVPAIVTPETPATPATEKPTSPVVAPAVNEPAPIPAPAPEVPQPPIIAAPHAVQPSHAPAPVRPVHPEPAPLAPVRPAPAPAPVPLPSKPSQPSDQEAPHISKPIDVAPIFPAETTVPMINDQASATSADPDPVPTVAPAYPLAPTPVPAPTPVVPSPEPTTSVAALAPKPSTPPSPKPAVSPKPSVIPAPTPTVNPNNPEPTPNATPIKPVPKPTNLPATARPVPTFTPVAPEPTPTPTGGDGPVAPNGEVITYVTDDEKIPALTKVIVEPTWKAGAFEQVRPGEDGLKRVMHKVVTRNGEIISTTLVSETILIEPTPQIIRRGPNPADLDDSVISDDIRPNSGTNEDAGIWERGDEDNYPHGDDFAPVDGNDVTDEEDEPDNTPVPVIDESLPVKEEEPGNDSLPIAAADFATIETR